MSTTYRIKMSDGQTYQKSASSAGEAIFAALQKYPGRTVAECHSGMTEEEAQAARKQGMDRGAMAGAIFHDIPPHRAIPEEV